LFLGICWLLFGVDCKFGGKSAHHFITLFGCLLHLYLSLRLLLELLGDGKVVDFDLQLLDPFWKWQQLVKHQFHLIEFFHQLLNLTGVD